MQKKIFSFFTTLLMLCSFVGVMPENLNPVKPLTAEAAFTMRTSAPLESDARYYASNPFYQVDCGLPNCTCYAYGRAWEILGSKPNLSTGHAKSWWGENISRGAYPHGSTPKLGAIACWNYGEHGHVAVVESIEGNRVTLSESHYLGEFFDIKTMNADSSDYLSGFFGYIYIGDFNPEPPSIDLGTNFYAYITNTYAGKHLTNDLNNVSMRTETGNVDQVWKFERQGDNSYKIINCQDNNVLDVADFGTASGTNVQVWKSNDSDAQRWFIYGEPGAYNLKAKCSDNLIDITDGLTEDGTNVQMCVKNGSAAQKFQISKVEYNPKYGLSRNLGDNFYSYVINTHTGKHLTNDLNNARIYAETGNANQVWKFERQNDNSYKIISCENNYVLDVIDFGSTNGTKVGVWKSNDSTAQRWFVYGEPGAYYLKPKCNDNVIDVTGGSSEDGTDVQLWEKLNGAAQKFQILKLDDNAKYGLPRDLGDSFYSYVINTHTGKHLTNDSNNARIYAETGNANQVWKFERQNDNSYKIISCENNYVLDVIDFGSTNGTKVGVWKSNDSTAQRWFIYGEPEAYYLKPKCNDNVIDITDGSSEDGTYVQLWEKLNGATQKWKFEAPAPAPDHSKFTVDKTTVLVEETITFTAEADNTSNYMLKIDKDGKQIDTQAMPDGQLSLTFSEAGTYSAYVTASNWSGSVDSQSITFEVKTDITLYDSEKYTLPFSSDYTFKTNNSDVAVVSKSGVVTAISVGKAIISVIDADANVIQIKINVLPEAIVGDCNKDGELNVADVVFLQKYLVKSQNLPSEKFLSADINSDGKINVFDVMILKRRLLRKQN